MANILHISFSSCEELVMAPFEFIGALATDVVGVDGVVPNDIEGPSAVGVGVNVGVPAGFWAAPALINALMPIIPKYILALGYIKL